MPPAATDGWSPDDYAKFRDARRTPYFDLLGLLQRTEGARVLDVGCGTGELTADAHRVLKAKATLGLDSSPAMLAKAVPVDGVTLMQGSIPDSMPPGPFDVVVSTSALNWVPGHAAVLRALKDRLAPGGQLAIQMPSNPQSAFSRCAEATAQREPWATALKGYVYRSPVEEPERYAHWLDAFGFDQIKTGSWIYPQRHPNADGVLEFAYGGLLSTYRERLSKEQFLDFAYDYGLALREELGPGAVFFPFRRVFAWGRLSAA